MRQNSGQFHPTLSPLFGRQSVPSLGTKSLSTQKNTVVTVRIRYGYGSVEVTEIRYGSGFYKNPNPVSPSRIGTRAHSERRPLRVALATAVRDGPAIAVAPDEVLGLEAGAEVEQVGLAL
jgi:hypothetical protein